MYQPLTFDASRFEPRWRDPGELTQVIVVSPAFSMSRPYGVEYHPDREAERDRKAAAKSQLGRSRFPKPIRPKADPLATSPRPVGWHYAGWLR